MSTAIPPQRLVVDASVALKWVLIEPGREAALALRAADLVAPVFLRIEVANALRTVAAKGLLAPTKARQFFAFLQAAPVTLVPPDDVLELRSLEIALDLRHPIYDCVYLALAERMGRKLVTADARLLRALRGTALAGLATSLADTAA